MQNQDKYFKGQQKDEILICFFRRHWTTLVKEFLIFGLLMIALLVAVFYANELRSALTGNTALRLFFATIFAVFTFFLHRFFLKIINFYINTGIITDTRVIYNHKTLFIHDKIEAVDLLQIQDIEQIEEGFFPNLLGYGDIKIYLSSSSAVICLEKVPNVKFHFRCIGREKESRRIRLLERERGGLPLTPEEAKALISPENFPEKSGPVPL